MRPIGMVSRVPLGNANLTLPQSREQIPVYWERISTRHRKTDNLLYRHMRIGAAYRELYRSKGDRYS